MRFLKFAFLLLLVTDRNYAQPSIPGNNYLCWKISGNGLKSPSYVFGTIHIISKKDFFLPAGTKKSLESCTRFVTEIALDMDKPTKQKLAQLSLLPEGKSLKDVSAGKDYQTIHGYLRDSLKLSALKTGLYERFKPILIGSVILKESIGKSKSYEQELYKIARNKHIPNSGLELVTEQMKILDSIPVNEQISLLAEGIRNGEVTLKVFNQMVEWYKLQQIDKLYQLTTEDTSGLGKFESVLLSNRNARWIPVMENEMKNQSVFFAVGAAHLAGSEGILNLLRMLGYEVSPVNQ